MNTTRPATDQKASLLNIAVVGHTNTGKTSLIRTILRSTAFGSIEDAAGTTRHVERTTIFAGQEAIFNLYDTPGIEDIYALREKLTRMAASKKNAIQTTILTDFTEQITPNDPLEQEAKVIRQILRSDILLYVIDVREPILEKYLVELELLSKTLKPIIPVFNFIEAHRADLGKWRRKLAEFNIHASLELDTVAFAFEAEKRLYQKIQSLAEDYYQPLQRLIDFRAEVWRKLCQSAARRIVTLIVTAACYRQNVDPGDHGGTAKFATQKLQAAIRQAEQDCLLDLLAIFDFTQQDVALQNIPIQDGYWQLDLFAPGVLKTYGLDVGSSALKGAAAGAGIDLMVGGLSLGAASLLGALAGTGWSTFRRYGKEIQAKIQGTSWLCADENTLQILYRRQQQLLNKLMHRGHAATHVEQVDSSSAPEHLPEGWREIISILRQNPAWSRPSHARDNNNQYQTIESRLITALMAQQPV
ncbi:MAG: DUF3482 domain-containing protein [Nitrosomonas sp.]|nr:DUF3482 domain-containing protein [Nitrosomonas sp.]